MKKTGKLLVYVLGLLVFFELGLRVAGAVFLGTPLLDLRRFQADPLLVWKFNPGYKGPLYGVKDARINSAGFLGDDFATVKSDTTMRVALVGGSVSWGMGALYIDETFPHHLQKLFNEKAGTQNVEVVNFSVPGYSSWHGKRFAENRLSDYAPDIVLLSFGWNDGFLSLEPDSPTKEWRGRYYYPLIPALASNTALGYLGYQVTVYVKTWLTQKFAGRRSYRQDKVPRVPIENFRDNIRGIVNWCLTHDIKVLLWSEPQAQHNIPTNPASPPHELYTGALRDIAVEAGIPFADVEAAFYARGTDDLYHNPKRDYVHPNGRGQQYMARIISETLRTTGWLDLPQD